MNLQEALKQYGLNEKEIKVYLALLELGSASVLNISQKAELKRPTVYLILESLIEKKLVSKIPKAGTTAYIAENPDYLLTALENSKKTIQDVLPMLRAIYNIDEVKPQIRFYEGKKNVERIWLEDTFKSPRIDFISSITALLENYPHVLPVFNKLSEEKRFSTRELVTRQPKDLKYAKKYHSVKRQIRVLPKDFHYTMDMDLYENKVVLASLKNDFLVMIESEDVAKSFHSLYKLAWQSAEKVK